MSPVAIASSPVTPQGVTAAKAALASAKIIALGLESDGSNTPYSTTSTAVSEDGGDGAKSPLPASPTTVVNTALPSVSPSEPSYYASLFAASEPLPTTHAGATVFGSAIDVLEALAVKESAAVWVYDDAVQVGFGTRLASWDNEKIHPVQTRQGAGLELAGYARKAAAGGKISVFASTSTLAFLAPYLASIEGDVVVHVAATEPSSSLELADSLASAGVIKALTTLPEEWDVVFSAGADVVATAAHLYGASGKVVHVIDSTYSARETTSWKFPSTGAFDDFVVSAQSDELYLAVASHAASSISAPKIVLNTLSPSPEALFAALAGETKKTVTVTGPTRGDAEALKAVVLAILYSAPHSSTANFPVVKAAVTPAAAVEVSDAKVVSLYTAPGSPLPQLIAYLFLSSPTLTTALAQYGSTSVRGIKSVVSLSTGAAASVSPSTASDVIWVSDANVLKATDVLATAKDGAIVVLDLPWTEEEIPVKLSAKEISTIQSKGLRVFLFDVDAACPLTPIREQVAFLLLYTGSQKLPRGVWNVLDAFHAGKLGRELVEDAQASLGEIPASEVKAWEVDPEEVGKTKAAWSWDALPSDAGLSIDDEFKPTLSSWELAARHVLFREAFAVPDAKTVDPDASVPGINALRPSTPDETFLVTVSENRRLTPVSYDRNVFHLELDTAGTGLKYEIGEAIGIHGWNEAHEVLEFCSSYGLNPDSIVSFTNPLRAGTVESRTVFQLLQQNIDLFGRPGKSFYASLAKLATVRAEAMTLKFISAPEGAELFQRLAENETVTYADVLGRYRSAHPSIQELIELIPEIKPRHYSIASSQKAVGDKVELLIVTVDWINSKGLLRYGQCTRYLAALKPGAKVTVSIKPSVMKLPPDNRQPIIMAGLGTGAAPFRAFMQHRAWQRSQGIEVGPLVYYFGSRYRSQEYLYGEDIEAYIASGIISHAGLAFSRDGKDKVYIQHKMKQDKAMLAKMLTGKGPDSAYFYLCGPTWPVPDVFEALASSLTEEAGMDRTAAEEYIEALKEDERYVLEVY